MNDDRPRKNDDGGGAGWIMTFADLMSLLMCFFVLLLSFAELDIMKFKAIAGSMKLAFGVQREIKAIEVPKGTSVIAQEFSSASPQPTLVNEVRQETIDEDKQSLEFTDALVDELDGTSPVETSGGAGPTEAELKAEADAQANAEKLREALQAEIEQGMIEIETEGASIIIRIQEKGSFPSGKAKFDPAFMPVVLKLRQSLNEMSGQIIVAGHTDDVPIRTKLYRSNWDLSSARAVSVVHALLNKSELEPARFLVEGHGEAHPLVANDSASNRALNRRVEITIRQSVDAEQPADNPVAPAGEVLAAVATPAQIPAVLPEYPQDSPRPAEAVAAPAAALSRSPFPTPVPATVPAPPPAAAPTSPSSVFQERPATRPQSRIQAIRDGVRRGD